MSLNGIKVLVTAGPTYEPIDPVRFIGNRSSGKQGYAIAEALSQAGAHVILVSGPTAISTDLDVLNVQTTDDMLKACESSLPVDIAICAAAVSDWKPENYADQKMKKQSDEETLTIELKKTPDILHSIATHAKRPGLVIGFAAETENLLDNAKKKLETKNCDWVLANDVSNEKVFGADENHVYLVQDGGVEEWPPSSKSDVAQKLVKTIIEYVGKHDDAKK